MATFDTIKSKLTGLLNGANETTGEQDATLTDAVTRLQSGYGTGAVTEPLSVTANGTYTPGEGVDGYNPVTVDVPGVVLPKLSKPAFPGGVREGYEFIDGSGTVKTGIVPGYTGDNITVTVDNTDPRKATIKGNSGFYTSLSKTITADVNADVCYARINEYAFYLDFPCPLFESGGAILYNLFRSWNSAWIDTLMNIGVYIRKNYYLPAVIALRTGYGSATTDAIFCSGYLTTNSISYIGSLQGPIVLNSEGTASFMSDESETGYHLKIDFSYGSSVDDQITNMYFQDDNGLIDPYEFTQGILIVPKLWSTTLKELS